MIIISLFFLYISIFIEIIKKYLGFKIQENQRKKRYMVKREIVFYNKKYFFKVLNTKPIKEACKVKKKGFMNMKRKCN